MYQAATFTAFCENHDSETFAVLEKQEFTGNLEQCFLIAYRAICWEFFQKTRALKTGPTIKNLVDLGVPEEIQQVVQNSINVQQLGFKKGLDDLRQVKTEMDKAYFNKDYSRYALCEFVLDHPMFVAATGAITPNRTPLTGKPLQTLHDTTKTTQWLSFGMDVSARGISTVFVWRSSDTATQGFMDELMMLSDEDFPRFLTQLLFAHCENTYFSEAWWDALTGTDRVYLGELMANDNPYYFPPKYELKRSFNEPRLITRNTVGC